jgi:CBS-domain-containing membrane protein
MQTRSRPEKLCNISPEDTLWSSIEILQTKKIHRLPVISSKGALLHILTHSHLLAYLVQNVSISHNNLII